MNSHTTSMYIPRMDASVTEHYIKDVIENSYIGKVSRIDFTPIGKGPGFKENYDDYSYVKSAFIHFEYHYHNEKSVEIREKLSEGDSHRLYLNIYRHNGDQEYWILLKATNPVKETMMNNHQIVDNCRFLEDKIAQQELTIIKMSKVIMVMNENIAKLDRVQQLVLQSLEKKPYELKRTKNVYNVISTEEGEYIDLEEDDNVSISSTISGERIKASCDLCGNQ
jgi:hypothetical protein